MLIDQSLGRNLAHIEKIYEDSGDIIKRKFFIGDKYNHAACVLYVDNLANSDLIENAVINRLMINLRQIRPNTTSIREDLLATLTKEGITAPDIREEMDFNKALQAVASGDTALFVDGCEVCLVIASRGFLSRGVPTAETEILVQGSKEAFSESMRTNTMLIRRRIRDKALVVKQTVVGKRSHTDVAIVYNKDIVREDILEELTGRIDDINIDAILDIGYIAQLIEDKWQSPFPGGQVTERPDKAAAAILEGRIAIIADNSPFALIVPSTLNCFFQSPEDYYQRYDIMSLSRILRYIACIIAVTAPGLYLAIALYNPNMFPSEIMYKMAASRMSVPFPALIEFLIMDMAFELLREAGIRLPSALGGTIGIIGGIIIGQAAVEAGIVSPIVVIIVALTGICGFTLPSISLVGGIRIAKYILLIGGATFGLFGFWVGVLFILIHLASLKSFGIPYLYPFVSSEANDYSDVRDTIIRPPTFMLNKRSIFAKAGNRIKSE